MSTTRIRRKAAVVTLAACATLALTVAPAVADDGPGEGTTSAPGLQLEIEARTASARFPWNKSGGDLGADEPVMVPLGLTWR